MGIVVDDLAAAQYPDSHGRLELTKFHTPPSQVDNRHAPANTPGIRHVAFAVEDIDAVVADLRARGAELVGELERYEDSYRLCYVRGPEGSRNWQWGFALFAVRPTSWGCEALRRRADGRRDSQVKRAGRWSSAVLAARSTDRVRGRVGQRIRWRRTRREVR